MDDSVKIDILKVLDGSIRMIERKDISGLKELSNHTIHNASIFQDEDSITVAVVMYTLAKVFERERGVDKDILPILSRAKRSLVENHYEKYKNKMKKLYKIIGRKDSKHNLYVQEVMRQASVRKSSKIYDHGVSMARATDILGVSVWDMMDYVGKTKIADTFDEHLNLKQRLAIARKIFGGK